MPNPTLQEKRDRADKCNVLIRAIGMCGRRFFYSKSSSPNDPRVPVVEDSWAYLRVSNSGHIFFVDDYTRAHIYTHYPGAWKKFTHGGTLKSLIEAMREYICGDCDNLAGHLGPWPQWVCNGDLWGYGEDMQTVRDAAIALGLLPNTPPYSQQAQNDRTPEADEVSMV